jgi:hypothetical protein
MSNSPCIIKQLEANVAAGKAVHNPQVSITYPLDDSKDSKRARIIASLVTLQNLEGPGRGCPAVSTTLLGEWFANSEAEDARVNIYHFLRPNGCSDMISPLYKNYLVYRHSNNIIEAQFAISSNEELL